MLPLMPCYAAARLMARGCVDRCRSADVAVIAESICASVGFGSSPAARLGHQLPRLAVAALRHLLRQFHATGAHGCEFGDRPSIVVTSCWRDDTGVAHDRSRCLRVNRARAALDKPRPNFVPVRPNDVADDPFSRGMSAATSTLYGFAVYGQGKSSAALLKTGIPFEFRFSLAAAPCGKRDAHDGLQPSPAAFSSEIEGISPRHAAASGEDGDRTRASRWPLSDQRRQHHALAPRRAK